MSAWWFPSVPVTLAPATTADAEAMAAIHSASFAHDWSVEDIDGLLAEPLVFGIVARRGTWLGSHRPVGFVLIRAVAGEAEVLTIAVDPRKRGGGIGRQLMRAAIDRLTIDRVGMLFLEVDEGNGPAVTLYRGLGFREVGRRAGYYSQGGRPAASALVMRRDLG
ncbi:MAG: GNAT family N-acetyltransferase [Hyphomicrobiaceae bacterium]|nr:GNAT family N-acetyltransferase [Hyphomicrobiaceae bacterium]